MDLSYAPEYERYREELRSFLSKAWTDEDRARAGEEQVIGSIRKPTARETEFRCQAIAAGYLYRDVPRAYAAASSRSILSKRRSSARSSSARRRRGR